MPSDLVLTSDVLHVTPLADDVIDRLGFDPRSNYVETFWLGVLGPSTTWLLRRLVAGFDDAHDGYQLPLPETARALGLGDRGGRNSPFVRALGRCVSFGLAEPRGPDALAVRRRVPPLSRRHLVRLPASLQEAHGRWQSAQLGAPADEQQRRRGRQLALSLLELGEDAPAAERQLLRWRYHPVLAREAAAWALTRHQLALAAAEEASRAGAG